MPLLDRIARRIGFTRETHNANAWAPIFAGSFLSAPCYGGRSQAENIACICAYIDVISSAIATLPALVCETLPDGNRGKRPDHPVARLMTLEHVGNGQPTALNPLPWWNAQPIIVPAQPETAMGPLAPSGRLAFDTLRTIAPWGRTGVPKRYFAEELFYLRDRPDTGVLGSSRLSRAPMLVQQGLSVQAFATDLWDADSDRLIPQAVGSARKARATARAARYPRRVRRPTAPASRAAALQ